VVFLVRQNKKTDILRVLHAEELTYSLSYHTNHRGLAIVTEPNPTDTCSLIPVDSYLNSNMKVSILRCMAMLRLFMQGIPLTSEAS